MLRIRFALFAAAMLALPSLCAQEYPGKRVRPPHLAENWVGSPEAYLTEGRIVLRSFEIDTSAGGMRINGKLWSDFEVEAGNGSPAGQLMGIEVEVSLHEVASDIDDKLGAQVPSQSMTVKINGTEPVGEITLGTGSFSLPVMSKPLPPGVYRLACRVTFNKMTDAQKEALKWVRDLYAVVMEYDEKGIPIGEGTPVYKSKFHIPQWRDMVASEVCRSEGTLFLGNVLQKGGGVKVDKNNSLCRDPSYTVYKTLDNLAKQRELLNTEYDINRKNKDLDQKVVKASYEKSVKQLEMLVARAGGKMESKESGFYAQVGQIMKNLREAIIIFEDDLTLKYWIALDTFYYYFHTVNKIGYNVAMAIDKGNNAFDRDEREKKAKENEDPAKKAARDELREKNFKYIPEPIKKVATEYARRSEETSEFDSASFTRKEGKVVHIDNGKWSAWRVKFLADFRPKAKAALDSVDVSAGYAIQKWSQAFKMLVEVRDSIIAHAYCYEWHLRMIPVRKQMDAEQDPKLKAQIGADADKAIDDDWATEAGEAIKELKPIYSAAKVAPASVFSRFETAYKQAKSEKVLDMADYAWRYKLSVDKQPYPPPRRYKAEK